MGCLPEPGRVSGMVGLALFAACASSTPPTPLPSELTAGVPGSARPQADARVCFADGLSRETVDPIAVLVFEVEGELVEATGRVERRAHPDSMEATQAFDEGLLGGGLRLVDRARVDARHAEIERSGRGLIDDDTAASFGRELGARTLIFGRYRFSCEGRIESGRYIRPSKVLAQSVEVRGIDVETGRVMFQVTRSMSGGGANDRLLPKSLARAAARTLLVALQDGSRSKTCAGP